MYLNLELLDISSMEYMSVYGLILVLRGHMFYLISLFHWRCGLAEISILFEC